MAETRFTHDSIKKNIGRTLGPSKSVVITQKMIDQFSEATHDPDPMHIDPEWCEKYGPYPTTISFGFLTMSLLTSLVHDLLTYDRESRTDTGGFPLNYGFNKLRLIAPVPVNSKISATVKVLDVVERKPGQFLQTYGVELKMDGVDTPVLAGEWLALWASDGFEAKVTV